EQTGVHRTNPFDVPEPHRWEARDPTAALGRRGQVAMVPFKQGTCRSTQPGKVQLSAIGRSQRALRAVALFQLQRPSSSIPGKGKDEPENEMSGGQGRKTKGKECDMRSVEASNNGEKQSDRERMQE